MKKTSRLLLCILSVILLICSTASAAGSEDKGFFEKIFDKIISLYHKFFPEKSKTEIIVGKSVQPENTEPVEIKSEIPDIKQQISSPEIPLPLPVAKEDKVLETEEEDFEHEEKVIQSPAKKILLKSRQFVPAKGISSALKTKIDKIGKKRFHVLMQFEHPLSEDERKELEDIGVKLVAYVPDNAWYVSVDADKTDAVMAKPFVHFMDSILVDDKISPYIKEDKIGSWALHDGLVALIVEFHEDISLDEAENVIRTNNGVVHNRIDIINALTISMPKGLIKKLAEEDAVQWIEEVPPNPSLHIDQSVPLVGGNTVQVAPYNLNGSGVNVLVYDGGNIDADHPDLIGRVTNAEIVFEHDHSTHVAGIVGGDGSTSGGKLKGMAPAVNITAYDIIGLIDIFFVIKYNYTGNIESEYYEAINTYGVDIATNSWGYPAADEGHCERNGDYTITSKLFDQIVRGSLNKWVPVVFSAGNDRNVGNCTGQDYNTITTPATAKNVISVGAIRSDDGLMYSKSSRGPVDDGRIKPDLVAPGCQLGGDGGINSTITGGVYDIKCGTSQAAPHVAGAIALMFQEFRNNLMYGFDPMPSTVKALLIHTADNNIAFAGAPDYVSGYGLINITRAIDIIKYGSPVEIQTHNLITGENDTYYINAIGLPEIKATLVWDDPAGEPFAAKELVNDLDLVLIDPSGAERYPWALNASDPSASATTGIDNLNNVEQVYVSGPTSGIWKIVVKGTSVNIGPQSYSLVSEALLNQVMPEGPPLQKLSIVNMQHSSFSINKIRIVQRFNQLSYQNMQNEMDGTLKIRVIQRFSRLSASNIQHNSNSFTKIKIVDCIIPESGMTIAKNTGKNIMFCNGTYNMSNGIIINASNIMLICNNSHLLGRGNGVGILASGEFDQQHWMNETNNLANLSPIIENLSGFINSIIFLENITIKNCNIKGFENGINLTAVKGIKLINNSVYNNSNAGMVLGVYNGMISSNKAYNNQNGIIGVGINTTIKENEAYADGSGITAIGLGNNISANNVYNNKNTGITMAGFNNEASFNNATDNLHDGISLTFSFDSDAHDNIADNNREAGISIREGSNNTINNNLLMRNKYGFGMNGLFTRGPSAGNMINSNNITNNEAMGIGLNDGTVWNIGKLVIGYMFKTDISTPQHTTINNWFIGNHLNNPSVFDLVVGGSAVNNNEIYSNDFYGGGVSDSADHNIYCVGGVGNSYYNGAAEAPDECENTTNTPPTAAITSPANNIIFTTGTWINFMGFVYDVEDLNTTLSVEWSSDIDGFLGTSIPYEGGNVDFATNMLSINEHIILLNVTDSAGLSATDQIMLNIVS